MLASGGLLCALLIAVAGPLSGAAYDSRFGLVLAALSFMLILEGLSAVHLAKLRRDFRYRAIATRRIITNVIGGVIGVTLAFMGWGVWAPIGRASCRECVCQYVEISVVAVPLKKQYCCMLFILLHLYY